ncbi:MerR family transcriptional regulator [bacterium]|nr:MerR family transcriptional regulator [bacterium]
MDFTMTEAHQIPDKLYFKIGEVAEIVGVEPYVLRYWETEFKDLTPVKSRTNQRLYKKKDVELLLSIRDLLHKQKFTIKGARVKLKDSPKDKKDNASQLGLYTAPEAEADPKHLARHNVLSQLKSLVHDMKKELD